MPESEYSTGKIFDGTGALKINAPDTAQTDEEARKARIKDKLERGRLFEKLHILENDEERTGYLPLDKRKELAEIRGKIAREGLIDPDLENAEIMAGIDREKAERRAETVNRANEINRNRVLAEQASGEDTGEVLSADIKYQIKRLAELRRELFRLQGSGTRREPTPEEDILTRGLKIDIADLARTLKDQGVKNVDSPLDNF